MQKEYFPQTDSAGSLLMKEWLTWAVHLGVSPGHQHLDDNDESATWSSSTYSRYQMVGLRIHLDYALIWTTKGSPHYTEVIILKCEFKKIKKMKIKM